MAPVIATGQIRRPDLIKPEMADLETVALATLGREGLIRAAYVHEGRRAVTVVLNGESIEAAEQALNRLPFVRDKQLDFEYVLAHDLLEVASIAP